MNDITENGKYYIPSIEEFHVGFICEHLSERGIWLPTVIEADNYMYDRDGDYDRDNLLEIASPHDKTNFRVKRLCHEDILLCGWEETKEIGAAKMYKHSSGSDLVFFNSVPNRIEVQREQPYDCNFSGTLNNINELRTIMKQIGI